jgi:hypothetical protein
VLVDNLVSPSHRVFLVSQGACVEGCMLRVTYMTQTSSLPHVHVLNYVHRCFMLDTINTGAQSNVTLFEFVGVRMSVFVTVCMPCVVSLCCLSAFNRAGFAPEASTRYHWVPYRRAL